MRNRPIYKSQSRCQCGASLPHSPAEELAQVKLEIEKAKLAKLQEDLPDPDAPEYTRWEDLPPPSPEDEERYYEEFKRLFDYVVEQDEAEQGAIWLDGKVVHGPKAIFRSRSGRDKTEAQRPSLATGEASS